MKKPRLEVIGGSFGKSLGVAHADGTPKAVDVRSPVRDPVGDISLCVPWETFCQHPVGDADIHMPSQRQLVSSFWRKN